MRMCVAQSKKFRSNVLSTLLCGPILCHNDTLHVHNIIEFAKSDTQIESCSTQMYFAQNAQHSFSNRACWTRRSRILLVNCCTQSYSRRMSASIIGKMNWKNKSFAFSLLLALVSLSLGLSQPQDACTVCGALGRRRFHFLTNCCLPRFLFP